MTNTHPEETFHKDSERMSNTQPIPAPVIERGLKFLRDYFAQIGAQVFISVQDDQPAQIGSSHIHECIYRLTGDLKPLKRNPQYLSSLSKLTSMSMSAEGRQRYLCQLDLDGRLVARRSLLKVIAEDAAAVAKHTHKRAIIEGLSASERRHVHQQISHDQEVETLSDGEDQFRYLMVAIKT